MIDNEVSTPRNVIVTGGALGIGGGISRRFATDGDNVLLVDINNDAASETAAAIVSAGGTCTPLIADVTTAEGVASVATFVDSEWGGRVDVLVNNVGDFRPAKPVFVKSTPEMWEQLYRINLWHVLAMTHEFAPRMITHGTGNIVNVSTVEAFRGIPGHAAYSAYKAGVSAFTKSMAVELSPNGIRVNAIAPDLTDTPQTSSDAMLNGRDPELIPSWIPLGRFGQVGDHADVVAFLASNDSRFVTGVTIPVDGGTLAASGWHGKARSRGWTNMPDGA